jgi:hypothetical protein
MFLLASQSAICAPLHFNTSFCFCDLHATLESVKRKLVSFKKDNSAPELDTQKAAIGRAAGLS